MATEGDVSDLSAALERKDLLGLMVFIQKAGRDALVRAHDADFPLIVRCAACDFVDGVTWLGEEGADLDACDEDGHTALHHAKSAAVVQSLISAGAHVDSTSKGGHTPLMLASFRRTAVAEALIGAGADVNVSSDKGMSPLMVASQNGHKRLVRLLLVAGADASATNAAGEAAAEVAEKKGHAEIAAIIHAGAVSAAAALAEREEEGEEGEGKEKEGGETTREAERSEADGGKLL